MQLIPLAAKSRKCSKMILSKVPSSIRGFSLRSEDILHRRELGRLPYYLPSPECTSEPSNASGTPCQRLSRFTPACVVCESGHAGEVDMDLANGFSARVTSLRRNFALYSVNAHLDHFNKPAEPEDKSIIVGMKNPWPKVM